MSRGNFHRETDFPTQTHSRGEHRKVRQNDSKQSKPFTGFTSPYKRLNEEAWLQKNHADSSDREKQRFSRDRHATRNQERRDFARNPVPASPARSKDFLRNVAPDAGRARPESYRRKAYDPQFPQTGSAQFAAPHAREYDRFRDDSDKYNAISMNSPWNSREPIRSGHRDSRFVKRLNDNAVYGKVSWEYDVPQDFADGRYNKNYEKPMDPKEFREQSRLAYLRAAQERRRNAELSVWGKCDWATYDKYQK